MDVRGIQDRNKHRQEEITYRSSSSLRETWTYIKSIGFYILLFAGWMYVSSLYVGFGDKVLNPMVALMLAIGCVVSIVVPSQREQTVKEAKWWIAGYLGIMWVYRFLIVLVSGVSAESLGAAFNQPVPTTSGTSALGWLQAVFWIIAFSYPIGFIGMEAKKIPMFIKTREKSKTIEQLRDIRENQRRH